MVDLTRKSVFFQNFKFDNLNLNILNKKIEKLLDYFEICVNLTQLREIQVVSKKSRFNKTRILINLNIFS